jgi:hypothetical protein
MYLPMDQISAPLVGESGVFIILVTNRTEESQEEGDDTAAQSRSNFETNNALLDAAKVEDNRLDIFEPSLQAHHY